MVGIKINDFGITNEELVRRYNDGDSLATLVRLTGASRETIKRQLQELGITIRQRKVGLSGSRNLGPKIFAMSLEGMSPAKIAKNLKISVSTVRSQLARCK